jgi:hypothetical protein
MEHEEIIVSVNGERVSFDDLPALIPIPIAGEILGLTRCPFTGCRELGQLMAGSGGSQGLPAMAVVMASSAVTPWAAAESR